MGRKKKEEIDKRKNISLSINNDVLNEIDKILKTKNLNRSEFVEKLWKDYINNENVDD